MSKVLAFLSVLPLLANSLSAQDTTPPLLINQLPQPNSTVREFFGVEVFFSEDVINVEAGDLLLNGVPATNVINVTGTGFGAQFIFEFPSPPTGVVTVAFVGSHGITDLAAPPNAFDGANWTFTLNPNAPIDGVVINEFMADNENGIHDEDGATSDWVELFNGSTLTVNLDGWYLTDDPFDLNKWRIPNVGIPPSEYLLIFASGQSRTNPTSPLHASFRLSNNPGSYLALVDTTGTNVVSEFLNYPRQFADVSYGRDRISPGFVGYYSGTNSTPGGPNAITGEGILPEVKFSRDSSTFVTPFDLTLSVDDTNAIIRYIIVNNAATASTNVFLTSTSPVYSGPIAINGTMQVRARAFPKSGVFFPGPLHSESYIQIHPNVLSFSSDLPLIIIHNFGQGAYPATEGNQTELNSVIAVLDADLDRSSLTNHPVLVMRAGINTRGSSTLGYAKRSFAVEFWDEANDNRDEPLLGMPAESDWTLYAPNNFEPGLIHNPLYYRMSREVGRYASRTRFAELFLNDDSTPMSAVGTNDYNGVYVIAERPKRASGRVDIESLQVEDTNAPAVTGGYFLSIDRVDANERSFGLPTVGSVPGQTIIYKYPKGPDILLPQRDPQEQYIRGFFGSFVTNLASTGFNTSTGYVNYIDVDSWVDHMIISVTAFNVDALRLSGFFYKDRNKPIEMGPVWDCDRCLGSTDGRDANPRTWRSTVPDLGTDFFNYPWWGRLFSDPDFWQRYIDRYQEIRKVAYSDTNMFAIIDGFAAELAEAYPREFAKWRVNPRGANGTGVGTFATEIQWKKNWMSARLNFMDTNFLSQVALSLGEGQVTNGTLVTLTPPNRVGGQTVPSTNAVVYYTLNGTDPRAPGGSVAIGALSNLGPITITVSNNIRVFARAFNPAHSNLFGANRPPLSSSWSGPSEATYWLSTPPLRITEIMYHPADAPPGVVTNQDNFEYVEVKNIGTTPLNVHRFRMRGGVDFDFPNGTLAAGERAVVVRNLTAFQSRYGTGPRVLGVYTNDSLANEGERLILQGGAREPILDFSYDDDWYPVTDGPGFSLQIVNDNGAIDTWGLPTSWRPSGVLLGTPGAPDSGAPNIATIYVNEAMSDSEPLLGDAIELYNPTVGPVNIGGWFLTDNFGNPKKYRIPNDTIIGANSYLVFYQNDSFGLGSTGFALSSQGEEVYIFSADLVGNLTGWTHGFDFGAQAIGATFGRHVISTGEDRFVTQTSPTLGTANSGPKVGPIVISEINYHPADLLYPKTTIGNNLDEYIELRNISANPAPLYDPLRPANTWRLRDAVDFSFPPGVVLAPGAFALVVGFDPGDSSELAIFRAVNNVPAEVPVLGPWSGQLDNSMDGVELARPDVPDTGTGFVAYILADKVAYESAPPWPTNNVDGFGFSLQRIDSAAYGNDPGNWRATQRTAGNAIPTPGGTPPQVITQPNNLLAGEFGTAYLSIAASGSSPLSYQWLQNGVPIRAADSPLLTLTNLRTNQAGVYSCRVFNPAGTALSSEATLIVRTAPKVFPALTNVIIAPDPRAARMPVVVDGVTNLMPRTNVTLTVVPTAEFPPITYQWTFNGVPITGANSTTLTITNVQFGDEGDYACVVSEAGGAAASLPARLVTWFGPILVDGTPVSTNLVVGSALYTNFVSAGSPVRLGLTVIANPPPRFYWRLSTSQEPIAPVLPPTADRTSFVTYTTPNVPVGLKVYGVVTNASRTVGQFGINIAVFNITTLADNDQDGMPDAYEITLGLNTNNAADALDDLDLDGMSNQAEYLAGTDPANNLSNLRVDLNAISGFASVEVAAVSNRSYTVQFTDDLASGSWTKLADLFARQTNQVAAIPDPNWTTNRYYRVVLPQQP